MGYYLNPMSLTLFGLSLIQHAQILNQLVCFRDTPARDTQLETFARGSGLVYCDKLSHRIARFQKLTSHCAVAKVVVGTETTICNKSKQQICLGTALNVISITKKTLTPISYINFSL